jgi:hypothetical protein
VCGGTLAIIDVDLWNEANEQLKRRVMHRTAIMFQRTFALYGNDRVIENVLHALDDIDYPAEKAINRAADLLDQVHWDVKPLSLASHLAHDVVGGVLFAPGAPAPGVAAAAPDDDQRAVNHRAEGGQLLQTGGDFALVRGRVLFKTHCPPP